MSDFRSDQGAHLGLLHTVTVHTHMQHHNLDTVFLLHIYEVTKNNI